jgi:GNAT superfamily N-acetyltransferase
VSPLRTIRDATAADATLVTRIVNRAYEIERVFIDGDRTSPEEVVGYLDGGRFLILEEDNEPVGCVYVEVSGDRGYFGMLAVLPDFQGGGRGRALVDAVEDACRAAGCSVVDLHVVDLRDELHAFYRRLGYTLRGEKPWSEPRLKRPARFIVYSKSLRPA